MRVKIEESFKPITITIETQDELDQLQGLLNHSYVVDGCPFLQTLSEDIEGEPNVYWERLAKSLDREYKKYGV